MLFLPLPNFQIERGESVYPDETLACVDIILFFSPATVTEVILN